jgi:crotonobetainyl-CoA:carnitine CoA-transferase CaiB-like acyl-CoA transferase
MAGMSSAFAILLGLERRRRTGEGSFVEVSMVEAALNAAAEQVIEYSAYGAVLARNGNRSLDAAPQGLYRGAGDDEWLAISIATDAHWQGLTAALGHPPWATDEKLANVDGRRQSHDLIDAHLDAFAGELDVSDAVDLLVRHGVPAARVHDARLSSEHAQMVARGFFETVDHPVVGNYPVASLPFRFADISHWHRSAAPTLGQHNEDILVGQLQFERSHADELTKDRVIGNRPAGADRT